MTDNKTGKHKKERHIGLRNVGKIDPLSIDEYIAAGGYEAFKKALKMNPDDIIKEIQDSGLRGRGGAGFSTGLKWKFTRQPQTTPKYVVCNADEGEPGTFKDRILMEQDPHSNIEGVMIAAYAIGAEKGYIYIRGEYATSIERTRKALEDAEAKGFLGKNILGSRFSLDIEIKYGGGSYLCGEESALIESLEGKRGYPRIKPPYPAEKGVFLQPTLVNNVETLAHVPPIIANGAKWYNSFGTPTSPGTKIFTICGDVNKPGAYETEMGISLKELLMEMAGGITGNRPIKTILCGGSAGTFIPGDKIDIKMDFDNLKEHGFLLGSGALIVMHRDRSLPEMLESLMNFFHHESCGKCVPCRVGMEHMANMAGECLGGPPEVREKCLGKMLELADLMAKSSLCPLGQSPIFPIRSIAEHNKAIFLN